MCFLFLPLRAINIVKIILGTRELSFKNSLLKKSAESGKNMKYFLNFFHVFNLEYLFYKKKKLIHNEI